MLEMLERVKRCAEELAHKRGESTSSFHVLIALFENRDATSRLLKEYNLRPNIILNMDLEEDRISAEIVFQFCIDNILPRFGHEKVNSSQILLTLALLKESLAYEIIEKNTDIERFKEKVVEIAQVADEIFIENEISWGIDLCEEALSGRLDTVICRETEIQKLVDVLQLTKKNNPALVGEAGVGKTAIIEGLAAMIVAKHENVKPLHNKRIIALKVSDLLAGTCMRGTFEDNMKNIFNYIEEKGNIVLFVDELHTLMKAGSTEGSPGASDILKPALQKGLSLVGATTPKEFRKLEKDLAFERRFTIIDVHEPPIEDTIKIIEQSISRYCVNHGVSYPSETIKAAVTLSDTYLKSKRNPDKGFDLIDMAGVVASRKGILNVTPEIIAEILTLKTGIPVYTSKERQLQIANLESDLKEKVVGHDYGLREITKIIKRSYTGLSDRNRPIGVIILLGPPGVGKTKTWKRLAELLFGSEDNIIRFDMSEFKEPHSVAKFIGSPPGYVGYNEGGQLTELVKRRPHSIILFDEIEQANKHVWEFLLPILGEGRLTDSSGVKVDFSNCFIAFTGNIGSTEYVKKQYGVGFTSQSSRTNVDSDREVMKHVKTIFSPQFLDRIDKVIIYHYLTLEQIKEVVERVELFELKETLKNNKSIHLTWDGELVDILAHEGYSLTDGMRNLKRTIEKLIVDPLSDKLISENIANISKVHISISEGKVVFQIHNGHDENLSGDSETFEEIEVELEPKSGNSSDSN